MKIKKLTMNGFGPYTTEVEIDFDRLNEEGLFLITGNTGAGKTTIFDGISYALYGEVNSKNIEKKNGIICDFLQPEEYKNVFVELEFQIGDKEYKIRRTPRYSDHTKSGKAETLEVYNDGKILSITKKTEMELYIKNEIIKLEQDQFNKIMILPQGAFNEFIKTNSNDKAAILNKIFGTDFYKKFEKELSNKFAELEEKIKNGRAITLTKIQDAKIENNPDWNNQVIDFSNQIKILTTEVEKHNLNLVVVDKERDNLLQLKETVRRIVDLSIRKDKESKNIEDLAENIKILETENTEIIRDEKLYKEKEEACIKKLEKLKNYQSEAKEIVQKKQIISDNIDKNKKYEKSMEIANEEIAKNKVYLEKLNEEHVLLEEKLKIRKASEETLNNKKMKLKDYQIGITISEELEKNKSAVLLKGIKLEELREIKNKNHETYNLNHELFLKETAYILSESIKEGEPCPVCGNIEHKHYPEKPESSPSKEELEKYKKQYEEAERLYSKSQGEYETLKKAEESQTRNLQEWSEKENIIPNRESILEAYSLFLAEVNSLETEIKKLPSEIDYENSKGNIKKCENILKQHQDVIVELDRNVFQIKANSNELMSRIQEIEKKFTEDKITFEKLNEEIESQNKEFRNIRDILQKIDYVTKKLNENKALLKNAQTSLKSYSEELEKEKTQYDIFIKYFKDEYIEGNNQVEFSQISEIITSKIVELEGKRENIIVDRASLIEPLRHLENFQGELEKKIAEFEMVEKLLKIAKGTHPNQKDKISFEKYVLRVYFQEVLDRANLRFSKMTNGQYTLRIADDTYKTGNIGLELNIFDTHTGKERSIMTLSGGESFKASMALALGLSDVVQFKNGGIALDSVFIDEGFGTLDEESLSSAMDILIELKSSGRTVGIISHVTELKNTIPSQIVVEKIERGSRAYVKY